MQPEINQKIKGIIFDLDGTLLNTITDIAISMNYALSKMNFPIRDFKEYPFLVGAGLQKLVRDAALPAQLSNEEYVELEQFFEHHYSKSWHTFSEAYSGIDLMLNTLVEKNITLSILSNKPDQFTREMAKFFFATIPFKFVWGARSNQPKKPDPKSLNVMIEVLGFNKDEILFVGDTAIDMQVARNAQILSVGVTWGFRPEIELVENGANFIVHYPSEILNLL